MALADMFDGFILDLDGVVYVGDEPVPGSPETIVALQRAGKRVLYLTNDARRTREGYAAKLRRLGVPADAADVITCGAATAACIRADGRADGHTAYVIGSTALAGEMAGAGLHLLHGAEGRSADVVVVGGHEAFDFAQLRTATQAVLGGAALYGTNRDATFPMPDGPWPGTGSILAAVEFATGRTARVAGKPEAFIFDMAGRAVARALAETGGPAPAGASAGPARVAMVGDRLDADIAGGHRAGLGTILVLSGCTRAQDLAGAEVPPDHVVERLAGVL